MLASLEGKFPPAILGACRRQRLRQSIGATGTTVGEVVFNTSMTGYQEILTDPQLLPANRHADLPVIGNVGANDE